MRTGFTTGNIESKVRSSRDVRTLCCDKTFAFGSIAVTVEENDISFVACVCDAQSLAEEGDDCSPLFSCSG